MKETYLKNLDILTKISKIQTLERKAMGIRLGMKNIHTSRLSLIWSLF